MFDLDINFLEKTNINLKRHFEMQTEIRHWFLFIFYNRKILLNNQNKFKSMSWGTRNYFMFINTSIGNLVYFISQISHVFIAIHFYSQTNRLLDQFLKHIFFYNDLKELSNMNIWLKINESICSLMALIFLETWNHYSY